MDASRPVLWPKFTRFRGDTKRLRFTLTDDLGAILRPSEHSLLFSIVDATGALLVQKAGAVGGFTTIDDPAGVVDVELVPADDAALVVDTVYECDVQAQHTTTHAVHTVKGTLRLVADATPGTTLDLPTTTTNPSAGYTWNNLAGRPTTLAGYGITDALTASATLAADATVAANAASALAAAAATAAAATATVATNATAADAVVAANAAIAANGARDAAITASQRRATADVRDYGAVGNGTTDDTAAIQAALSSSYAHVYVPPGIYRLTSQLRIPSNKRLTLADSAIMLRTAGNAMLINDADGTTGAYEANANITVEGGTWDGQSSLYPTPCTLITFGHASDIVVRDCTLRNAPSWHCLELNGCRRATVERVRFTNAQNEILQLDTSYSTGTFPWFGPYDNTRCEAITIRSCHFSNGYSAIGSHSQPAVDNLLITGCVFDGMLDIAFKPLGYTRVILENSEFKNCAYVWQGSVDNFICCDNRVSGSTAIDFNFSTCTNGLVANNLITGVRSGITGLSASVVERDNLLDGVATTTDLKSILPYTAETLAPHALHHDGTAAKVVIASPPTVGTHDFHLSAWYYPLELRDNTFLVGRDEGGTSIGLRISGSGVLVLRAISTADVVTSPTQAITVGQWNFIEAWRTGGVSSIAVNGVTLASQPDSYPYLASTGLSSASAVAAHGLLARVRLLNFVPTAVERARLYRQLGALPREWRGGTMNPVTAGALTIGARYTIASIGTTSFTAVGAATNAVGIVFTATAAGAGTGTAYPAGALWALDDADLATAGQPVGDVSGGGHVFTLPSTGVSTVMSAPDNPVFSTAKIGAGSLTSGLLQVGSVAPSFLRFPLQIGGGAAIDAAGFAPSLYGRRFNGSLTSPTAVTNGQGLINLQGGGHDGSTVIDAAAALVMSAAENWNSTSHGSSLSLQTTSKGAAANLARVAVLDHGAFQTGLNPATNGTPAWGTSGIVTRSTPGTTHTDTTSSGMVAAAVAHSLAPAAFAATNATTYTDAANLHIAGDPTPGSGATFTNAWGLWNAGKTRLDGRVALSASTTIRAGLNLAPGTAPTSPIDGDVWTTSAGVYARIAGSTVGPFASASGSHQSPATIAALKSVNVTGLATGYQLRVAANDQLFLFNATDTRPGNDVTIVAPASGSGRWNLVKTINDFGGNDLVQGREYLSHFHKRLMAGSAVKVVFTGDSTTEGTGLSDSANQLPALVGSLLQDCFPAVTTINAGHSSMSTTAWLSTYLAADLAASPDLYIIRWGINDGSLNPDTFLSNLASGLATIRASATPAQLSLVLMAPNATNDTPTGRDAAWYERVVPALPALARTYQCTYLDTYSLFRDAPSAADRQDNPYSDGRHVHPLDVMNLWIASQIFDVIAPGALRTKHGLTRVQNLRADQFVLLASATPASYPSGISLARALPAHGWTLNGAVTSFKNADGVVTQLITDYTFGGVQFRVGAANAWQTTQVMVNADGTAITVSATPATFVTGNASYNVLAAQGWPADGLLLVSSHISGMVVQLLVASFGSSTHIRSGSGSTWQSWTRLSGTNTGDQTSVTGNAGTATALATSRTINGVPFNGTADVTVPAPAGTLTGTILAANVTSSSLTGAAGGTFGTAAFTASTSYATAAQGTKADAAGAITGLLKSNGSGTFAAATPGTDYLAPTGNGAGLAGIATSVAGKTGAITLTQGDIGGLTTSNSPTFNGLNINVPATSDPSAIFFRAGGSPRWIIGQNFTSPSDDLLFYGYGATSLYDSSARLSKHGVLTLPCGLELNSPNDVPAYLRLHNGTGTITLIARPFSTGALTLYLPSVDGSSGQVLKTDGSGQLSFGNVAVANGGTGATTPAAARANLGATALPTWASLSGTAPDLAFSSIEQNIELTLSGNTDFSASGYSQGAVINLFITGGSQSHNVTFPGFSWVGGVPASLAAGKLLRICLECRSTTAAGVCASYAIES